MPSSAPIQQASNKTLYCVHRIISSIIRTSFLFHQSILWRCVDWLSEFWRTVPDKDGIFMKHPNSNPYIYRQKHALLLSNTHSHTHIQTHTNHLLPFILNPVHEFFRTFSHGIKHVVILQLLSLSLNICMAHSSTKRKQEKTLSRVRFALDNVKVHKFLNRQH